VIQRIFVSIYVVAILVLPFVVGDIYPSTTMARFREPVAGLCRFTVTDPAGRQLPLSAFDLHRNFNGLPVGLGVGRQPAPSLDRFGQDLSLEALVPTREELRQWMAQRWDQALESLGQTDQPWPYLTVSVQVIGPVGRGIDVRDSFQVVVFNPDGGQ